LASFHIQTNRLIEMLAEVIYNIFKKYELRKESVFFRFLPQLKNKKI
jgi:hypothetical protein